MILCAEIQRCKHLRPGRGFHTINGNYPHVNEVYKVLYDLNFYRIIGVPEDGHPPQTEGNQQVRLKMASFVKADAERIAQFKEIFTIPFSELSSKARKRMQGSIIEAIINSLEHAFSSDPKYPQFGRRAWLSGYINERDSEIAMVIFDQGVGIPETLPRTMTEKAKEFFGLSDSALICAASALGRTATHQSGRGKGFKTMKDFIDICDDAELRVFSNRGQFRYQGHKDQTGTDSVGSIGGTLVMLRIRHKGNDL